MLNIIYAFIDNLYVSSWKVLVEFHCPLIYRVIFLLSTFWVLMYILWRLVLWKTLLSHSAHRLLLQLFPGHASILIWCTVLVHSMPLLALIFELIPIQKIFAYIRPSVTSVFLLCFQNLRYCINVLGLFSLIFLDFERHWPDFIQDPFLQWLFFFINVYSGIFVRNQTVAPAGTYLGIL